MQKNDVANIIDIGIICNEKAEFFISENGFIGLRYNGQEFKRVVISRILPFRSPEEYISILDKDNKEIGILRSIEDLTEEQAKIVRDELIRRYYCPIILEITSVKEKMGYVYFHVNLLGGSKNFAIKDVSRNIRQLENGSIVIFDVDGNRFIIEKLSDLDSKSVRRIQSYLF